MECFQLKDPVWLEKILFNPQVTDLCFNGIHSVFVDCGQGFEPLLLTDEEKWTEEQLKTWTLNLLSIVGKTWDAKYPFVDAILPTGYRLHIVFPPLARQGILISLRKQASSHESGTATRWKESPFYAQLAHAIYRGDSIIISGATGSGKTTLASDLLEEIAPNERIIALEDTPELNPRHPHFLTLVSRTANADGFGEITLRTLLKQTLRMRPDRIILGECRGVEILELLQALNTGHRGALTTLHANSPRDALRRIELLCLLASEGVISSSGIRELLSIGIQWIAQVQRSESGRHISELWKIEGREGDIILMRPMLP